VHLLVHAPFAALVPTVCMLDVHNVCAACGGDGGAAGLVLLAWHQSEGRSIWEASSCVGWRVNPRHLDMDFSQLRAVCAGVVADAALNSVLAILFHTVSG
jgi:hypothetical protein